MEQQKILCSLCKVYRNADYYDRKDRVRKNRTVSSHYCNQYVATSVCGIDIGPDATRESIDNAKTEFRQKIEGSMIRDDITFLRGIVECPICLEIPNPERAVTISCCDKVWCLDCALEHMKIENQCSHCRVCIHLGLFYKAKVIQEILEGIETRRKNEQKMICKDHDQKMNCFCNDCDQFICTKCLLVQHREHNLVEASEKYSQVKQTIHKETSKLEKTLELITQSERDISDKCHKSKEITMAEVEPPLTLISEHLTKHHQESWGWFDNYATSLQKVKEYQKTNVGCNQALVAQKSFNNLREMYRIQKETESLNKDLMIFQDHYAKLSANSQFSVEKYTFEFELAKHSGRMLADATSNNLNLQLWIQDCVGSIQLTPIKKKADKDTSLSNEESKEETKEQSDICLENKNPSTELDNSESTINQPELSTKTMDKESEITLNLPEKYLLFQEEKLDLFGNHEKLLTVHKFLSVIKPSTPLSLPLDSFLDSSTNTFKIKFLVYDYSPALQEHLKDSLTSVAGMLKEALERTQQVVDKLDDQ